MNKRILVLCSSREGQTRKIVNTILKEAPEWQADIYNLHDHPQVDLKPYDKVLIAASIRYGHFHTSLNQFVKEHQATLAEKDAAFISVNLVARKLQKNTPETNPAINAKTPINKVSIRRIFDTCRFSIPNNR